MSNDERVLKYFRKMVRKHGYLVIGELKGPFPPYRKGDKITECGGGWLPFEIVIATRTTAKEWKRQWAELSKSPLSAIEKGTRFWRVVKA
jgi:hypothetical protein